MNLLVIGASNGAGLKSVETALRRGHRVTAFARHPDTIPDQAGLIRFQGDATRMKDIDTALAVARAGAVVVALGTGQSVSATTLFSKSAEAIVSALKKQDKEIPLIVLSGFGEGDSYAFLSASAKNFFDREMKDMYADKTRMVNYITSNYPDWTIVRPTTLSDGPFTGKYRVIYPYTEGMHTAAISRADVADFLINQCERNNYKGKFPLITN